MYGHVYRLVEAIVEGAREIPGVKVGLYQVPELVPYEILEKSGAKVARSAFAHVPIASITRLAEPDGLIFGTERVQFRIQRLDAGERRTHGFDRRNLLALDRVGNGGQRDMIAGIAWKSATSLNRAFCAEAGNTNPGPIPVREMVIVRMDSWRERVAHQSPELSGEIRAALL